MKIFIYSVYQNSVSSATPTLIGHPERYSCHLLVWQTPKKSRWAREVVMHCWEKILSEKCREVIWFASTYNIPNFIYVFSRCSSELLSLENPSTPARLWKDCCEKKKFPVNTSPDRTSAFSYWFKGNILVSLETYMQHSSRAVLNKAKHSVYPFQG